MQRGIQPWVDKRDGLMDVARAATHHLLSDGLRSGPTARQSHWPASEHRRCTVSERVASKTLSLNIFKPWPSARQYLLCCKAAIHIHGSLTPVVYTCIRVQCKWTLNAFRELCFRTPLTPHHKTHQPCSRCLKLSETVPTVLCSQLNRTFFF